MVTIRHKQKNGVSNSAGGAANAPAVEPEDPLPASPNSLPWEYGIWFLWYRGSSDLDRQYCKKIAISVPKNRA
jgi:hypothetical protein